ncbi:S-adenosyl-L-methionine-dependent methyltransferase [Pluteus cervinus]|uniref:S-adenosyl-L-methionine-dependent methyltransferase n=1 Tax=Pluteus cervinus TaxID=181527 RepID=A0ACD3AHM9_9AGAR|nr:S-adenosyl-L-methionine-dependent methyltransferase [Pluteus cervinus]
MADSVLQLSKLISDNSSHLVSICSGRGFTIPHLNDQYTEDSENFRKNTQCAETASIIVAAALQLVATLSPPQQSSFAIFGGHYKSASVRIALDCNVPEILREAGDKGLHADEIAAKSGVDGKLLARHLRFLSNYHTFREISPNVFANTRLSSVLDSGKSVDDIIANPHTKHDDTPGFVAIAEQVTGDLHKSTGYALEAMKDASSGLSPFQRAYNEPLPYYKWLETPENAYRFHRFGIMMRGFGAMQPPDAIEKAYPWNSLPQNSVVVDVGGGIGTLAISIARAYSHLKVVVQDTEAVVEEGETICKDVFPAGLTSGNLSFEAHDFFSPNPIKNASVYILKNILHNWPDALALDILRQLRVSATPETKLIVIGTIIGYTCRDYGKGIENVYKDAPEPLLPNYGAANDIGYVMDVTMSALFNAKEFTIGDLKALLEVTGWKVVRVQRSAPPHNFFDPVIAVPV